MTYILDANAMIAWLRNELGADVVREFITDIDSACFAHSINLCEVFYDVLKVGGEQAADEAMIDLATVKVTERNDFDTLFWQQAARLKATHRHISLADCFAVTLSQRLNGILVTSDHKEIGPLAKAGICRAEFFR